MDTIGARREDSLNEIADEIGKDADRLPIKCWM